MTTQIDWRGELDRAIEPTPHRPSDEYVASGHRALRRRRATTAVVGVASAVLLGGLAWTVVPGDGRGGTESGVATRGASPSATDDPDARLSEGRWRAGAPPVQAFPGSGLQIRPGSVVHERRDDIYPGKGTWSAALDVTYAGKRWWVVVEWDDGGSVSQSGDPESDEGTFASFVADAVADGGMFHEPAEPAEPARDELTVADGLAGWSTQGLVLGDGVTLVRRVDNPHEVELPRTSVGLVLEHDGTITWASAIAEPSGSGSRSVDAAESGWLTFDQWLADDVALQAGERGLRLVAMDDAGNLRAREPGVEIVEVVDTLADPDVAAYVGRSATASAAAELTWRGATWFVLVVRDHGDDSVTTFAAAKADGADTIEEFLDFARQRGDEGEGLR